MGRRSSTGLVAALATAVVLGLLTGFGGHRLLAPATVPTPEGWTRPVGGPEPTPPPDPFLTAADLTRIGWSQPIKVTAEAPNFGECVAADTARRLSSSRAGGMAMSGGSGEIGHQVVLTTDNTDAAQAAGTELYNAGVGCGDGAQPTWRLRDRGTVPVSGGSGSWFLLRDGGNGQRLALQLVIRNQHRVSLIWLQSSRAPRPEDIAALEQAAGARLVP